MYRVPKEILAKTLLLRRFEPSDLDAFRRFMTDPEATRHLAFTTDVKTSEGAEDLLRSTVESYDSPVPMFALAAAERGTGILRGMCGLNPLDEKEGEVEIFYAVFRELWGRGIGSEIAVILSRYALFELAVRELVAFIVPANVASVKVAERTGFRRVGLVENANFSERVYRYTLRRETAHSDRLAGE